MENTLFKSVALGCDHAGFDLKEIIKEFLSKTNIDIKDFGTFSLDSVDYPDFAVKAALSVSKKEVDFGIVICGSGIGVSISANKVKNIRAALCANAELAGLSKMHNNANVLALGARFISQDEAIEAVKTFMVTKFEGGRHIQRVEKIHTLTNC